MRPRVAAWDEGVGAVSFPICSHCGRPADGRICDPCFAAWLEEIPEPSPRSRLGMGRRSGYERPRPTLPTWIGYALLIAFGAFLGWVFVSAATQKVFP